MMHSASRVLRPKETIIYGERLCRSTWRKGSAFPATPFQNLGEAMPRHRGAAFYSFSRPNGKAEPYRSVRRQSRDSITLKAPDRMTVKY